MKRPDASRRNFFAVAAMSVTAAVVALKSRSQKPEAAQGAVMPADETERGYRKTEHVSIYYRSARF